MLMKCQNILYDAYNIFVKCAHECSNTFVSFHAKQIDQFRQINKYEFPLSNSIER